MTEFEFGDRLRQYRKAKLMTQQELAERLSVSDKSVSRWENGSYPDVAMLGPLARELGVTVDDLLGTTPPLKKLERSDLQNWLSYAFALGGGVLFFLLNLFTPTALCYLIYLGLMAYGVYLQKHYTFHSKWFHISNLVMNFFVNLTLAGALLPYLLPINGLSLPALYEAWTAFLFHSLHNELGEGSGTYALEILLLFLIQPGIAIVLTSITAGVICRWQKRTLPPVDLSFSRKYLNLVRVLPALCPVILALYLALFTGVSASLPIWFYQHQRGIFYALWTGLTLLCVLLLILQRQKGMLIPFAFMQWTSLYLLQLCRYVRAIGQGTGTVYPANGLSNNYIRFAEGGAAVFVLSILLAVIYFLCCFIKFWQTPVTLEDSGKDLSI